MAIVKFPVVVAFSSMAIALPIHNAQCKLRLLNLASYSLTEALITNLKEGTYCFNYHTDVIECITHLFFVHLKNVELLERYPKVFLLD